MTRNPQVAVEPRSGARWGVQTELPKNKTELVIKNNKGQITAKDSHASDPRRFKG
jgi:hypothetical protein